MPRLEQFAHLNAKQVRGRLAGAQKHRGRLLLALEAVVSLLEDAERNGATHVTIQVVRHRLVPPLGGPDDVTMDV